MTYLGWTITQSESGYIATCPWFAMALKHDSSLEKLKIEIEGWEV